MRPAALLLAIAASWFGAAFADTTADLMAIEQARSAAIAKHDAAFLENLYADDFSGVTATGYPVDRKVLLGVFARPGNGTVFAIDELKVRPLGDDVAIVTGRLTGRDPSGRIVARSRYLHVYSRRENRWQIVAGEGTALPLQE